MAVEIIDASGYDIQITPRLLQGYDCHVHDNTGSVIAWTCGANSRKQAIADTLKQIKWIQDSLESVVEVMTKEEARDE